jgi:hypothetical protein
MDADPLAAASEQRHAIIEPSHALPPSRRSSAHASSSG